MITRKDIYEKEAKKILEIVSLYKILTHGQITKMFPGKESVIETFITRFAKDNRFMPFQFSKSYEPHLNPSFPQPDWRRRWTVYHEPIFYYGSIAVMAVHFSAHEPPDKYCLGYFCSLKLIFIVLTKKYKKHLFLLNISQKHIIL